MIPHHLPEIQQKALASFEMDDKKLIKVFIYSNESNWIEYFTGFLFMIPNQEQKIDLKVKEIHFPRHPNFAQIEHQYPLEIFTDNEGFYTLIRSQKIKAIENPEKNVLLLKMEFDTRILAISFYKQSYCNMMFQHLSLILENCLPAQMSWSEQNLKFVTQKIQNNLIFIDELFILDKEIAEFLKFFNKVDKKLYLSSEKDLKSKDYDFMKQFFQILKQVFVCGSSTTVSMFISSRENFQTVLKCLSYNPFGLHYFNYLEQFKKGSLINSMIQFQNGQLSEHYEMIIKIKFLQDVAICTFIQISTETIFFQLLNKEYLLILSIMGNPQFNFIKKLKQLSLSHQYNFICLFSEIWDIFKAASEEWYTDFKATFYKEWIKNFMFQATLSALSRLLKQRQVSQINSRFWQKMLDSLNPMLSYNWQKSQKITLAHKQSSNHEQTSCLMSSLILILANCDSTTKILILDFVRVQICTSQNRTSVSAKYLSYLYNDFISKSYQYCSEKGDVEKYIDFIQKIYVAQPIRTRHFIVEEDFLNFLKSFVSNKHAFIMVLKFMQTLIEVSDDGTFRYLSTTNFFDCLRQKYDQNRHHTNITNSLFLGIFKAIQKLKSEQGKKYLYQVFFSSDLEQQMNQVTLNSNIFKRSQPVCGLVDQI